MDIKPYEQHLNTLIDYAEHPAGCSYWIYAHQPDSGTRCDCGLTTALDGISRLFLQDELMKAREIGEININEYRKKISELESQSEIQKYKDGEDIGIPYVPKGEDVKKEKFEKQLSAMLERIAILEIAIEVWRTRAILGDKWPTPSTQDSLAFAVTEAAEVLDVQLRMTPQYKRNNVRQSTLEEELSDTIIMLVTALGEHLSDVTLQDTMTDMAYHDGTLFLADIADCATSALVCSLHDDADNWVAPAVIGVIYACRFMSSPQNSVTNRLATIRDKWGGSCDASVEHKNCCVT